MEIKKDKVVLMHYTLTDDNGEVIDSSVGKDPLAFIQGVGNIIPGLEKAVEGKRVGDKLKATILPEEAYGVRKPEMIQTAPLSQFDSPQDVQPGSQFHIEGPNGVFPAVVVNVDRDNDSFTFDMNHPLADKVLHFDVEIVQIRDMTDSEKEHGHAHGPGGHQH